MPVEGLSLALLTFICRFVASVEQLEILLLLARKPEACFTVEGVYEVIMSTRISVERWLDQMVAARLLIRQPGPPLSYRFDPQEPGINALVNELSDSYKAYPVRVIEAIYKLRLPSDPAQDFADAFRIRKN